MRYQDTDGVIDLVVSSTAPQDYPEVCLTEVNEALLVWIAPF